MPRYPRHEAVPLWLRLDFNMLDSARLLPLCCAEADPTKPDVGRPREIKASRAAAAPSQACPRVPPLQAGCQPKATPARRPPLSACACRLFDLLRQVPDDDEMRKWRHNLRVRVSLRDG